MNIKIPALLIGVFLLTFSGVVQSEELSRANAALNTAISDFVQDALTTQSSDLFQYIRAMMFGMAFIGVAWHTMMWAIKENSDGQSVIYICTVILMFAFYYYYNPFMAEMWSWSDGIGLGVQQAAVGSSDTVFIGERILQAIRNFFLKDISIWDGFNAIVTIIFFKIVSMLLSVVVFIITQWGVWGYAFAKVSGLIFLPMFFIPLTREFFVKWFQIFLGFWFFNLFSKIALSIYYIYFFAIFGAISDPLEFDPIADQMAIQRMSLHFLIGIVFLIASGGLASMMASGFSGVAKSATGGITKAAAIVTRQITKI